GLVINRFSGSGIVLTGTGATGDVSQGNFVGTDASGLSALANLTNGVSIIAGAHGNVIGGTTASARNVISGNANGSGTSSGVNVSDSGTTANVIEGNYIGVGSDGSTAVGNGYGVSVINAAAGNVIGG